jgi:hypothetical protein
MPHLAFQEDMALEIQLAPFFQMEDVPRAYEISLLMQLAQAPHAELPLLPQEPLVALRQELEQ